MPTLTPIQQQMLMLLSDGQPHTRHELRACLNDEQAELSTVKVHISRIRKHLRPRQQDIICELRHNRICYRHVQLLPKVCDTKRPS